VNAHTTQQAKDTEPSRSHSESFVRKKIIFRADTNYFSFGRKNIFVRKKIYFCAEGNYFSCGRKSQQERKTYNQLKDNELISPPSGMQFIPIHPAPTDKEFPIFALRKRKRVPQNKLGTPLHIHSFPQEGGMIL
jgi:hypothetical protein